jgi:transposase
MSDDYRPEGYTTGRPTKYRPEMCEQVIEWGKMGKSRVWMCSRLNIAVSTLNLWEQEIPEFSEALTCADMYSQAHWEDLGHENMVMPQGKTFSQSAWSRSMAARFPKTWRENTVQEVHGKDGAPLIPTVNVSISRPKS